MFFRKVDRLTIGVSLKSRYLSPEDLLEGSSFATGLGLKKGSVVWVEKRGSEPEVSRLETIAGVVFFRNRGADLVCVIAFREERPISDAFDLR